MATTMATTGLKRGANEGALGCHPAPYRNLPHHLQHVQDHLSVLRIVLVPAVVEDFPRLGQTNGGHKLQIEPGLAKVMGQRSMIIAGCLEPDPHGQLVGGKSGARRWKSPSVFVIVNRRRRFLLGMPIRTLCRCLEMSIATSRVEAVE